MIQKRKKYALAVDRGTTNACAVLFDARGKIVATAQKEFARIYPQPGWVEHNPSDIIETVCDCIRNVAANGRVDARDIKAIGIANRRGTWPNFRISTNGCSRHRPTRKREMNFWTVGIPPWRALFGNRKGKITETAHEKRQRVYTNGVRKLGREKR